MPDEIVKTRVTYRRWREKDGGTVVAILWDVPANPGRVMMYEHIGQHGEGDPGIVDITHRAGNGSPDVIALHRELTDRGYALTIVARRPIDWRH